MRTQTIFGITLVVSAGLSASVMARKAPPAKNTPVTSIISAYDSGVAPALQIQSDGLGYYTNSKTQASLILTSGDWRLDAYYLTGSTRKVALNFSQPIDNTGPNGGTPVAPPSGLYTVNFGSNCSNFGNNMSTLPPGQTMPCPMNVHFDYGGKTYDLHMAPHSVNFPETTGVNVTCIFPTSGTSPCSQWRIQPGVTYSYTDLNGVERTGLRSIANLSYETTVKGQLKYVKQGDFYFSFSIIVTNP